jgi:signal transduction histidine kinase
MPKGGTLTLKTYQLDNEAGQWSVGEIIDTGVGIPAAHLKKIFDPFYTSKAEGEGTGLGLSICHGIVQDAGGTIEVESRLHKGSRFRVLIPRPQTYKATGN